MKRLITESDITKLLLSGSRTLVLGKNDLITPLAMDKIKSSGVVIQDKAASAPAENLQSVKLNRAVIACDHTGLRLKSLVGRFLMENSVEVMDIGTFSEISCDFPDIAASAVKKIREDKADFAVIIDATGSASAMAANKFKGIRAADCYCEIAARSAREHSNANVITLGSYVMGDETARAVLRTFMSAEFKGGKYQERLEKLNDIK